MYGTNETINMIDVGAGIMHQVSMRGDYVEIHTDLTQGTRDSDRRESRFFRAARIQSKEQTHQYHLSCPEDRYSQTQTYYGRQETCWERHCLLLRCGEICQITVLEYVKHLWILNIFVARSAQRMHYYASS